VAYKTVKLRADLELTCLAAAGIRDALRGAEAISTHDVRIKASMVAAPLYVVSCAASNVPAAIQLLDLACKVISDTLSAVGGHCVVRRAARVTTASDERVLRLLMAQISTQTRKVDDDSTGNT
jgi:translation initiation factor 2 subunit 1